MPIEGLIAMHHNLPHLAKGRVLSEAFVKWANRSQSKWYRMYRKLGDGGVEIIRDSLCEMDDHKPGAYHNWWAYNHMRYAHRIRQDEKGLVNQLMYEFLTLYTKGKLYDENPNEDRKKKRTKAKRQAVS